MGRDTRDERRNESREGNRRKERRSYDDRDGDATLGSKSRSKETRHESPDRRAEKERREGRRKDEYARSASTYRRRSITPDNSRRSHLLNFTLVLFYSTCKSQSSFILFYKSFHS